MRQRLGDEILDDLVLECLIFIRRINGSGEHKTRNFPEILILLEYLYELPSVDHRHIQVE